jgi:hypothetical protein
MAEPTAKGFYERYGAHDGYGLRNRERWRKDPEGKMEPWSAAGSGWKEVLGFKRGAVRPGRRVEVAGFKHRDSVRIESTDERKERERMRVEYIQPEGVSWGVRGEPEQAAIAGPEGDGGDREEGEGSLRWEQLSKRGKELENLAQTLERARLHDLQMGREEAALDGDEHPEEQDEHEGDTRSGRTGYTPASTIAPTKKQIREDWEAAQRAKQGSEWTGESDFDPSVYTPPKSRNRPSKRQQEMERNLPPHLAVGSSTAGLDIRGARAHASGTDRKERAQPEPGQFVSRNERQTRDRDGQEGGRAGRGGRFDSSRGPGSGGFGIRRSFSTAPRRSPAVSSRPPSASVGTPSAVSKAPSRAAKSPVPPSPTKPTTKSSKAKAESAAVEDSTVDQGRHVRPGRKSTSCAHRDPPPPPRFIVLVPPAAAILPFSSVAPHAELTPAPDQHWKPTKKLTYSAMAGLRELHATDPERYTRQYLAVKFGISFEAVCRILKSSWRESGVKRVKQDPGFVASGTAPREEKSLAGTKWDVRPETSLEHSPVHAIRQASGRGQ